ncbi:zinc metalloproteinase nas-14-like [Hydractinia symbiolongicarpus]|uniref:zinc metalloproteinase nas-14-like n=1 Tax=Hydractinia symbiolongicarpus TaxID=13093 RepID=UPI00254FD982|nr:zinc metalloproteinase nas-14-like [Hydractinia symbiolongicarpus]
MKIVAVFLVTCLVGWQIRAKTVYDELEKDIGEDDLSSLLYSIQDDVKDIKLDLTSNDNENTPDTNNEYWINKQNGYTHKEEKFNGDKDDDNDDSDDEVTRDVGVNIIPWPKTANGELIIPYVIDSSIVPGTLKFKRILNFIAQMNNLMTCNDNEWRPRTTEAEYVLFTNSTGCSSYVGKAVAPQPQPIHLADGCVLNNDGTVLHEMMHAMGFYHEHQRSDRDSYIIINKENIQKGAVGNFDKVETQSFNAPYDYGSVMHYGRTYFSRNGKDTITPLKNGVHIGQRDALSAIDILQINTFYNCLASKTTPSTSTITITTPKKTSASTSTTPKTTSASTSTTPKTTSASTSTTPKTTSAFTSTAPKTTSASTSTTPKTTSAATSTAPKTTSAATSTTPKTTSAETTPTPKPSSTTTTSTTTKTTTTTTTAKTIFPSTAVVLENCDYENIRWRRCRLYQFRKIVGQSNSYVTYSPSSRCIKYVRSLGGWWRRKKGRTCVKRSPRNGRVLLYAFVRRSNFAALKCTCTWKECSDKKYCVSFSYRRRGVQKQPITSVEVALSARCFRMVDYQRVFVTMDLKQTAEFKTHHVEFHSNCARFFSAGIKTIKGSDTIDVDNFKLSTGSCSAQSNDEISYSKGLKREALKERLQHIQSKLHTVRDELVKLG